MIQLLLVLLLTAMPHVSAAYEDLSLMTLQVPEKHIPCLFYEPVTVFLPSSTVQVVTCEQSSAAILKELGQNIKNLEVVHDYRSVNGRNIVTVQVKRVRALVIEKIPFPIQITYTKELAHRKKIIDKRGATGRRSIIKESVTYENGKTKTNTITKWLSREPKTEYVRIGTKYDLQTKTIDGITVSYWGTLKVLATSYDSHCYGCNDTTATGAKLTKGIVAVDPRVIPLHTQMYIPGYGFGKAEDTGGMIKGARIDLGFKDIRYGNWSRRWVTIYLVD